MILFFFAFFPAFYHPYKRRDDQKEWEKEKDQGEK